LVYFIDANIFLEVQLKDEKSEECKSFLRKIDDNKIDTLTSDFIVYTCLIQIQNKSKSTEKLSDFMAFLTNLEAMEIFRPRQSTIEKGIEYSKKHGLDFDDGLVLACMFENNIGTIVSFDKDFDKVKEIKRIEPKEVLRQLQKSSSSSRGKQ